LADSIVRHASKPVAITALSLKTLPIKRRGLTEFTFSRFLVPWLCDFKGTALFLDADMVDTTDIAELFEKADGISSVQVNKNQAKFEWPSAMLFNCENCMALTPEYVEDRNHQLFDFAWATHGIGSFPADFNHCVGYAEPRLDAKLYHFTKGVPVWRETRGNVEDKVFHEAYLHMIHTVSHQELMGNSVHVKKAG
jgi:lipopolysaccharide biosynthesis glycosyltransferase